MNNYMLINIPLVTTVPIGHLHYDIKAQRLLVAVVKLAGRHCNMNKISLTEEDLPEVSIN